MMGSLGGRSVIGDRNKFNLHLGRPPLTSILVMTSKEQRELREEQIHSLKWAIDELKKEKEAITFRLEESRQASELKSNLNDALSEQETLNSRIADLQGNLQEIKGEEKESPEAEDLDGEESSLEERILIASERLSALEQDRDLEHIAQRFKGEEGDSEPAAFDRLAINPPTNEQSMEEATRENRIKQSDPIEDSPSQPLPQLGKVDSDVKIGSGSLICRESTSESLREAAAALDLDPEYLLDKSVQAVLRMIQRNKSRVTFPLEVKQVDSIG